MTKGAIIYSRVSTQGQADEGASLETQIAGAMEFAEKEGSPVLKVYREIYTGAELYDRPLLSEARNELKSGSYSHLIAYSIDRLSRDPIHLAIIAMECERQGVELMFVTEPLDSTPEGALIRYVRGYAAQVEREKIRERCVRGKRAVAVSGRIHRAGTDLYGYRRAEGKRVIEETEAAIVREIFEKVKHGASVRGVTRYLNAQGVAAPTIGKRVFKDNRTPIWGKSTVTRLLREPSYKGVAIAWRWKGGKVGGRQRMIERPIEERIPLPEGTTPAIVDLETWDAAQRAIRKNGGVLTRNKVRQHLLRGFIYCFKCGERCYTETSRGVRSYRCSSRQKRNGWCGARPVPAEACDRYVWESVKKHIQKPEKIREGMASTHDETEHAQWKRDLKNAKQAVSKSETGIDRLMRRFAASENDVLTDAALRTAESMKGELPALRERVNEIQKLIDSAGPKIDPRFWQSKVATVAANIERFGFDEKALTLRACEVKVLAAGHRVVVDGDLGTICSDNGRNAYKIPFRCDNKRAA